MCRFRVDRPTSSCSPSPREGYPLPVVHGPPHERAPRYSWGVRGLLVLTFLICAGCTATGGAYEEGEAVAVAEESATEAAAEAAVNEVEKKREGKGKFRSPLPSQSLPQSCLSRQEARGGGRRGSPRPSRSDPRSRVRGEGPCFVMSNSSMSSRGRERGKCCADVLSPLPCGARRRRNGPSRTSRSPALRSNGSPAGSPCLSPCAHQESRRGT